MTNEAIIEQLKKQQEYLNELEFYASMPLEQFKAHVRTLIEGVVFGAIREVTRPRSLEEIIGAKVMPTPEETKANWEKWCEGIEELKHYNGQVLSEPPSYFPDVMNSKEVSRNERDFMEGIRRNLDNLRFPLEGMEIPDLFVTRMWSPKGQKFVEELKEWINQ